ncbi:MAG: histidine kinase dimerization/phosphoacceptor domain -containing protein [Henriciella sp.]|uniref:sensor histidine kinase n=1 Tax=Henriciella sp. TaxID=1968823 RepID=UPI003C76A5B9
MVSSNVDSSAARHRFAVQGSFLAALVLIIAASVLVIGWILGVTSFQRLIPGYAAMVPSTALGFIATSSAVLFAYRQKAQPQSILLIHAVAVFIILIAGLDLVAIFATPANGIDQFIWSSSDAFETHGMAIATATSFILAGLCLLRLRSNRQRGDLTYTIAATSGLVLCAIALTGYAFDTNALYQVSLFTAMALHTAIAFFALFICLLLLRPDMGWIKVLTGDGGGSESARRLVPVVIFVPFTLCLIALWATNAGFVDANFRLSVLAIAMIGLLSASALWYAAVQNAIEAKLRSTIADRELLLREVYHRVKNNLQMTISLLRMGMRQTSDDEALEALSSTIKRVEAIGTVHRILLSSRVPSDVRAPDFVAEIAENVVTGQVDARHLDHLKLVQDVGDFTLHIDRAVTIGLLMNELLTNALRHAYPGDRGGELKVSFHKTNGLAVLTIADDGIGMTEAAADGTGTRITRGLVAQLDATWETEVGSGTVHRIEIPETSLEGG